MEKTQENNPTEEKHKSAFSFHAMEMLDIPQINTENVLFLYAVTHIKRFKKKKKKVFLIQLKLSLPFTSKVLRQLFLSPQPAEVTFMCAYL